MELLTENTGKLFRKFYTTALGSTLIASIYSTVDIMAVGHYAGHNGSAAISCINPLWSLMISLGLLVGIGGGVLMNNHRGAGQKRMGDEYFTVSVILGLAISLLMLLTFIFWSEPLFRFCGADDEVMPLCKDYFQWITIVSPAFLMATALTSFIRNDGAPTICTVSVISGGVLNIIGDYLLVFVADMGVSGAGLATAIGQFVSTVILCCYFFTKKCTLRFVLPRRILTKLKNVIAAGFSPFIVDITFGVVVILFNRQIVRYSGNVELGIYGSVSNIAILFQALYYAVGQALQPIVSANFGALKMDRVRSTLRISVITCVIMGIVFVAVSELIPLPVLHLYMTVSDAVREAGPRILRVYGVSFIFMGLNVMATYYLQSVLKSVQAVVISLLRGFVICGIFVMILPELFGYNSIWWTMPITEFLTLIPTVIFLRKNLRSIENTTAGR